MNSKRILKNVNLGILIGFLVVTLSFLISIVPCKKEAGIGVCQLPNPFSDLTILSQKYYFISNNPLTGLLFQFLIPLVIVLLITLTRKKTIKQERVVDYTKK
jgi:hypothetical protein